MKKDSIDALVKTIQQKTAELDALKDRLRQLMDEASTVLRDGATRKKPTITPLHREISKVVQTLRHAKNRNAPKAEIARLEKMLATLRTRLHKGKAI